MTTPSNRSPPSAGFLRPPISVVPVSFAMVTVMAEYLQIIDIERKAGPLLARLDVVYVHHSASGRSSTAALTPRAILLQRLHAYLAPLEFGQEGV